MQNHSNPYESPQSPPEADVVKTERLRSPFASSFAAIVAVQYLAAMLLAPGDGGRWLRYAIVTLTLLNLAAYLTLYSIPRQRLGTDPGLSLVATATLVILSVVCVVVGTFAMDALHLP